MKKWIAIAAFLAVMFAGACVYNWITNIGNPIVETVSNVATAVAEATLPPEPVTVTDQAMVEVIERKLELTVAELEFTTSVETGECDADFAGYVWNDCLTMTVPGKVEVDLLLDGFDVESIETTDQTVTINLPGVTVGDIIIDHARVDVVDQEDGLFIINPNPNLQAQGLAEATVHLHRQACQSGLLEEATLRAADRVKNLLQPLFSSVDDPRTINVVLEEPWC